MTTLILVEPATEPVTVAQVKANARAIQWPTDDSLIGDLITDARQEAEEYLRRRLITTTLQWTFDLVVPPFGPASGPVINPRWFNRQWLPSLYGWYQPIEIPYPRLQSITSVYCETFPGNWVLIPTTGYVVDTSVEPATIRITAGLLGPRLRLTYVAGYGDSATNVPMAIRRAIIQRVFSRYRLRSATEDKPDKTNVDQWESLLRPYRIHRL